MLCILLLLSIDAIAVHMRIIIKIKKVLDPLSSKSHAVGQVAPLKTEDLELVRINQ